VGRQWVLSAEGMFECGEYGCSPMRGEGERKANQTEGEDEEDVYTEDTEPPNPPLTDTSTISSMTRSISLFSEDAPHAHSHSCSTLVWGDDKIPRSCLLLPTPSRL
jgi:hypothetical protein